MVGGRDYITPQKARTIPGIQAVYGILTIPTRVSGWK